MSTVGKQYSGKPQANLQDQLQNCDLPLSRQFQRPTSRIPPKKGRLAEAKRLDTLGEHLKLSKTDINIYRNTYKHNICLDMLRQGYHKSFSEFTNLILTWNNVREAAGPGSDIWMEEPLDKQHNKLDHLQYFLIRAEAARRAAHFEEVYNNQLSLACYFKAVEDKLLSDHFFQSCLTTAEMITPAGGQKVAEANANMGLAFEEKGHLDKAAEHYEIFHQLAVGTTWQDENGCCHFAQACANLWRIYTSLADKYLENEQYKEANKSLKKAFDIAKEGGDKKMELAALYRVALGYLSSGDPDIAIGYLQMYLELSNSMDDDIGLGKTYEALAKALISTGHSAEALEYLKQFLALAEKSDDKRSLVDACRFIGIMYNNLSQYDVACKYIWRGYEIAMTLGDLRLLETMQVNFGIFKAHSMMTTYCHHVEAAGRENLEHLVTWKDSRKDTFSALTMEGLHHLSYLASHEKDLHLLQHISSLTSHDGERHHVQHIPTLTSHEEERHHVQHIPTLTSHEEDVATVKQIFKEPIEDVEINSDENQP
ncbi:tetratricopeptide repeat protein 29 isoform X1 [Scyliorhinus canicula]|uniref:tetratricopeptide repeat protein 29 isoform X1 n=3 Tax=Scyliorhinus canicula TaxID=7830 RepID=UPI0018F52363|nr:tetratricopeptide repeat protein 29 isoform X1 [Scyliorhinus canicula]XP_038647880.1 tetratricopeptide repeat protein 29 isoform X1 [Scyliorhinus canicula]XP_038647881.1 tetratricopeptide repeat protein 29 isoform X1 [Scyliorhinus canicula]